MTTRQDQGLFMTSQSMQGLVRVGGLLILFSLVFSQSNVDAKSHRTKRSEVKTCLESFDICKSNKTCWTLYRMVRNKCTRKSGKCTAEAKNAMKCTDNIESLRETAFPVQTRCDCPSLRSRGVSNKKSLKCLRIYNTIHSSPCYDKGIAMRHQVKHTTTVFTQPVVTTEMETPRIWREDEQPRDVPNIVNTSSDVSKDKTTIQSKEDTSDEVSERDLKAIDDYLTVDHDVMHNHNLNKITKQEIATGNDVINEEIMLEANGKTYIFNNHVTTFITTSKLPAEEMVFPSYDITPVGEHHLYVGYESARIILITIGSIFLVMLTAIGVCYAVRYRRPIYPNGMTRKKPTILISFHCDSRNEGDFTSQ